MLCACSGVKEARQTVATADSLRVNHRVAYDDSLALADAYSALGNWRLIYPDDYARACYYYGRLLRSHGNQVDAMRAFIAGTHVPRIRFHDHHILGRIYTNMGMMCHDADEFELAHDMYKYSAEQFQEAHDTTAYYYALNAMAYELAEQNLHDETFSLLSRIETECTDTNVLTKTWETKAELYRNLAQYDSAIYAARQLYSNGYWATSGYVTMAQAFWHLEQHDSAVYYAKHVLSNANATEQEKYNMLYLVTYCDPAISKDAVQKRYQERTDIDKDILDPLHIQLAQVIDVLTQDRNKKPHYINIGLLLLSLCIVGGVTWIAIVRIKRHRMHLYAETKRERQKQHDLRCQQETIYTERTTVIEQNCEAIYNSSNWREELHWKDYDAFCKTADHYFLLLASKLRTVYKLDEKEVRLCILVLLHDFSNKQLARHLNYGESGIGTFKYRVSKKLNISSAELRTFLLDFAVYGTPLEC